ncbi:unnamed protein product [Notodromas monacha]|uniref:Uncharacterized protein n=1 Tax=Notodromas monacha TaxID=399045 RepID=A0A7R9BVY2_9CRUS|nr:unnamed protein product [Notodromas monacha]CAG0922796.1 unnamed protein product [Notodromas monacha]
MTSAELLFKFVLLFSIVTCTLSSNEIEEMQTKCAEIPPLHQDSLEKKSECDPDNGILNLKERKEVVEILDEGSLDSEEDLPLADVGDSSVKDFMMKRKKRAGCFTCPTPKCVCCKAPKWLWSTTPPSTAAMMDMGMMGMMGMMMMPPNNPPMRHHQNPSSSVLTNNVLEKLASIANIVKGRAQQQSFQTSDFFLEAPSNFVGELTPAGSNLGGILNGQVLNRGPSAGGLGSIAQSLSEAASVPQEEEPTAAEQDQARVVGSSVFNEIDQLMNRLKFAELKQGTELTNLTVSNLLPPEPELTAQLPEIKTPEYFPEPISSSNTQEPIPITAEPHQFQDPIVVNQPSTHDNHDDLLINQQQNNPMNELTPAENNTPSPIQEEAVVPESQVGIMENTQDHQQFPMISQDRIHPQDAGTQQEFLEPITTTKTEEPFTTREYSSGSRKRFGDDDPRKMRPSFQIQQDDPSSSEPQVSIKNTQDHGFPISQDLNPRHEIHPEDAGTQQEFLEPVTMKTQEPFTTREYSSGSRKRFGDDDTWEMRPSFQIQQDDPSSEPQVSIKNTQDHGFPISQDLNPHHEIHPEDAGTQQELQEPTTTTMKTEELLFPTREYSSGSRKRYRNDRRKMTRPLIHPSSTKKFSKSRFRNSIYWRDDRRKSAPKNKWSSIRKKSPSSSRRYDDNKELSGKSKNFNRYTGSIRDDDDDNGNEPIQMDYYDRNWNTYDGSHHSDLFSSPSLRKIPSRNLSEGQRLSKKSSKYDDSTVDERPFHKRYPFFKNFKIFGSMPENAVLHS